MQHVLLQLLFFVSLLSSSVFSQENLSYQPKGATCVIHNEDGQVVLVQDYLTRTLSLPGGYIDSGETFQAAAKRETLEETGINVDIGELLSIDNNRVVFACQPRESVGFLKQAIDNHFGAAIIPALNSKHFGKEIRQVYLASLTPAVLDKYRYPADTAALNSWVKASRPSVFHELEDLSDKASELQIKQLPVMASFQAWVKSMPMIGSLLSLSNCLGEGAFAVGLFLLFLLFLPLRYSLTIAFALLATAYSVNLLKMIFAIPRPFYLLPSLQQAQASGFSFPSGHATQAAAIVGLLLGWVTKRGEQCGYIGLSTTLVSWLMLSLLAGAARVWLGVHYPADIVAGVVLGGLIALVSLVVYQRRYSDQKRLIESTRLWLLLLVVYFFATLQLLQPLYVFVWFAALGLFISLFFNREQSEVLNINHWQQVIASVTGIVVITGMAQYLVISSTTSIIILSVNALAIFSGILWILIGSPYLTRHFNHR
ncbi:bifunctional NUDIX hydrolase/phosphatase PAP2 family protein [Photobacterium leiognathi]|uniref:bifunctional NUDIX hydrolase/phosphatase PAP2 family protein n=1 Tax=Photobacterium leiognathi TaxID=553611 RepID=UPI000AA037ED|nr:bifunctional NUDIX hydrolase/phosphatase PAP2 family protein [Photobacterium leiognathi]